MKRILMLVLVLTLTGITATAQGRRVLRVTHFSYSFSSNDGSGENGGISFLGPGFSGFGVAGTER
jgi:hypothetical protein